MNAKEVAQLRQQAMRARRELLNTYNKDQLLEMLNDARRSYSHTAAVPKRDLIDAIIEAEYDRGLWE